MYCYELMMRHVVPHFQGSNVRARGQHRLDRAPGRALHRGRGERLGERTPALRRRERQGHQLIGGAHGHVRPRNGGSMTRTVFANADVLDGANPLQRGVDVVVEGNRIARSAHRPTRRPATAVIDLAGTA